MATMSFNPDDFIIEEFLPPEEKKPILEYTAENNIIFVRFKTEDGSYKYNSLVLNNNLNKILLENIPNEWSNDKDKLISFGIYDDGTYLMTKKKLKYDFNTNSTKWISYDCNDLTLNQAKEFFEILKSLLFVEQSIKTYEKDKEIFDIVTSTQAYLDEEYLKKCVERDNLLRSSDFRILEDYPETFEGEKLLWIEWRSKLRDIVKKMEDFNEIVDYVIYLEDFKWPIDPLVYYEKFTNQDTQYLSSEDQYVKDSSLSSIDSLNTIKQNVLSSAQNLKSYNQGGIPIPTQVSNVLEKYRLLDEILNMDTINFTIGE